MNRADLQRLADDRVEDARVLLEAQRFSAAYYLAGYSVECALKACIAKEVREFDFPSRKTVLDSYSHDLNKLLKVTGLSADLEAESMANDAFGDNWYIVKDWSEEKRYQHATDETSAHDLFRAVSHPRDGVLIWLKKYW